jgi:hypothetical protein
MKKLILERVVPIIFARETLNKCSFSTTSLDKVAPDEISKPTEDTGDDDRIRAVYEEDAAGNVLGRDGASGTVGDSCDPVSEDQVGLKFFSQDTTLVHIGNKPVVKGL